MNALASSAWPSTTALTRLNGAPAIRSVIVRLSATHCWNIGYEKVAKVVKESTATGKSPRQVVLEQKLMTEAELDKALDVLSLTKGGIAK